MAGGAYVALSGLRSRFEQLDKLSSDLANFRTTGYKTERSPEVPARRANFEQTLESAIDVMIGPTTVERRALDGGRSVAYPVLRTTPRS